MSSILTVGSRVCFQHTDWCAIVAQLVEHLTRNEKVAGSIPADGSEKVYFLYVTDS